jgi:polyphosphate glucokinase
MEILGVDIGGSGIKGALINIEEGKLITRRYRIPTPQPAVPEVVGDVVAKITHHFNWQGPVGCTFPGVVRHGITYSAANIDDTWIGTNGQTLLEAKTGCPILLLNDADAAGIAEMTFGAGQGHQGVVIILTFGTGIGSAIFTEGVLLPNTEFGHMEIRGKDAEHRAADRIRTERNLSWKRWAKRVNEFLDRMELLFSPDLFIIGGGVSRQHEKFLPLLETQAEVVPARFFNEAGIVGAAIAAKPLLEQKIA